IETQLLEHGRAPETVMVDPGQIVEAIRSISPESLKEIDLTPYRFPQSAIEHENVVRVANAILDSTGASDEQSGQLNAIRDRLTPDERDALQQIVEQVAGRSPATDDDRKQLITVLNRVIDDPSLHQSTSFAPALEKPVWSYKQLLEPARDNQLRLMKEQVDQQPENYELSRRLNRLLVARIMPNWIAAPTIELVPLEIWRDFTRGTQALSPHEVFMVWIKAAIIVGLVISGPWCFYQIWLFVAAGLYPHEQKYIYWYLPISILLFMFGVCLAFFFVFDPVLQFLFSFNARMGIAPQLRIGEWLSFVLFLPLGFGIAFKLPLVMLFTQRIGLVTTPFFTSNWRIAVMIIAVLSMLLTPADPISMIMLAGPLTGLYFFGIGLCHWMPRPQNPFGDETGVVRP
ncbi:MAG: twin-arginine translocase subunit TatC, partial [Pirellulaceae bacterium]